MSLVERKLQVYCSKVVNFGKKSKLLFRSGAMCIDGHPVCTELGIFADMSI